MVVIRLKRDGRRGWELRRLFGMEGREGWFYWKIYVYEYRRGRVVRRELSGFVRGDAEISIFRITLISDDLVTEVGAADNIFFFKNDQYFYFYQPQ